MVFLDSRMSRLHENPVKAESVVPDKPVHTAQANLGNTLRTCIKPSFLKTRLTCIEILSSIHILCGVSFNQNHAIHRGNYKEHRVNARDAHLFNSLRC